MDRQRGCNKRVLPGFHVRTVDNLLYGQGQQGLFHQCARPKFDFVERVSATKA